MFATEYLRLLHRDPHAPLPPGFIETDDWAETFLGAIRSYRDGQLDGEAQRAAKRFGLSATKDRYRFIWELWQNADDAGASTLRFVLRDGALHIENDGRPLSPRDVYSMCFVASSQKEGDIAQKGQFGIGLLSLMRVCEAPEVHSGPFHFRLDRTFTYPSSVPPDGQSAGTRIVAPLLSRNEGSKLCDVLVARAEEEVLLYMSNLRRVEVVDEDGARTHSIECQQDVTDVGARTVRLGSHVWLKYKTTINPPVDLQREDGEPVPPEIPIVMVRSESVNPPHRVSSFFPTAVAHSLPWRFSAPFEVTNSREALLDSEFNRWLLAEVGKAMVGAALDPKVGDSKAPWRLVPGADVRKSDLAIVYGSAHDLLRETAWVPTVTGLRKPSAVAIPASSGLRRLIKPEDVPDDDVKQRAWIRRTPDRAGVDLLDDLGAMELCCHELSLTLAAGPAREATWYLRAAAETIRLANKEEWDDNDVFVRLRDGLCFKDQRNRPFSLTEATAADKVVCSTRGEGLAKELGRLANRWIVMLHEVYREPRSKRKASSDLADARKLVDRWLTDESEDASFSYERALEAPQFIERFVAERDAEDFANLDAPTHQSLLTLVRDHIRGYRGRYARHADNQLLEIGRRIHVDAFSIDATGARVNAVKPVATVYLGSTYSKSEWAKAASGAPGIWWISSRYARLLKRKDEDGVVSFLRSLGAADGPRLQPAELNGWHGRHQFAAVLHGDSARFPHFPHDQRKFGYYSAHGTRGDHESPDIDAALRHISTLPEGARRARAAHLYRTIERSWETFSSSAFATAHAYVSNSESFMGQMPARWLYNLRIASWIKFGDGKFAPPLGRVASTPATRSALGAKDPEMTVWECVNDSFAEALGMHTKASTRGIIGRLRDLQQHDATIPIERAAAYFEALVPAIESEPGELDALRREQLMYHPTTHRKWWPADLCLQTDQAQIFGNDRAYLTRFPRAKDLWRYLAIPDEPRLPELAKWWRELEQRAQLPQPALQRQLEHSYRRAEDAWRDADKEPVPVLAEGEWRSSNRVVATDDDALWKAIPQFEYARWDQESPLRFQGFCRWAGMIVLEDYTEFGPPSDDGKKRELTTRDHFIRP